jgi:hypothetical protein
MVTANKATLGANKPHQSAIILLVVLFFCLRIPHATAQMKAASLAEFKNGNLEGKIKDFLADINYVISIYVGSLQIPQINNWNVRRDLLENRRPQ